MTIRTVAIATAVVATVNGSAGLLVPAQFLTPMGVELPEAGLLVTRIWGAHVLSLAVIDWFARNDLRGVAGLVPSAGSSSQTCFCRR